MSQYSTSDCPPYIPCPDCGSKKTVKKNIYKEDYVDVEYDLHCAKCDKYLGYFSYGNWEY